jgi:photolyase PhrII
MTDHISALPGVLAERCRTLNDRVPQGHGEFVLYWMHHAVRGHENPALDVALALATRLRVPLLVYQGLGGRHRYNADRHHRFILEGARDVQAELGVRGIRHVFWLPTDDREPSPLHALVARAAVLVCEDFPAPPFPRWAAAWAGRAPGLAVAVDAACIAPMSCSKRRPERAFAFRDAMRAIWDQRLAQPWQEQPVPAGMRFDGDPGFAPFDLGGDFDAAIAACAIDHALGPVAHTPGGSRAGYARWATFKARGLADYARLRNDAAIAWPRGVSRLSPYLHHGHVSPLRIAREARAARGEGAEKFLDELLVWRELAFHWCRWTADPESLDALPGWAQATLVAHAGDRRAVTWTLGELAGSRTGSALWNAAQDSLRRHGELHNNLRMTWGKAIVDWCADPAGALGALVDLNHRHALDGNDPASYGGLLWCLGLFDRPFLPERRVTGTLRPRDPDTHEKRLDLPAYRALVDRPAGHRCLRIAVVGAGLAGAAAARALVDQGHAVTVYEKSRGAGGRMATRRTPEGQWDFGAQYFHARDPRFRRQVADWRARAVVAPWAGRIANLRRGEYSAGTRDDARLVGVPGMNALARDLLAGIELRTLAKVDAIARDSGNWRLLDDAGARLGDADAVLLALPPAQAAPLVEGSSALLARARAASMQPAWSVRVRLATPLGLPFDAAHVGDSALGWIACDDSRPGRGGRGLHWVLQATSAWSVAQLELDPVDACAQLLDAWRAALGAATPVIAGAEAHRWRYALAAGEAGPEFAWDPGLALGLAGDWLRGARVEDAWLSGTALAGAVLRTVARD